MHFSLDYKGLECLDLKEKNRKQMCDQIKNIQFRVQKKIRCKSRQSSEKKNTRYSAISNSWLRKKLRSFKNSSYL